jgi:hypothetical protein
VSVDGKQIVKDIAFYSPVEFVDHIYLYNLSDSVCAEWEQFALEAQAKSKYIYKEPRNVVFKHMAAIAQGKTRADDFPKNDELDRALKKWQLKQKELSKPKSSAEIGTIVKSPWQERANKPEPYIWDHNKSIVEKARNGAMSSAGARAMQA